MVLKATISGSVSKWRKIPLKDQKTGGNVRTCRASSNHLLFHLLGPNRGHDRLQGAKVRLSLLFLQSAEVIAKKG